MICRFSVFPYLSGANYKPVYNTVICVGWDTEALCPISPRATNPTPHNSSKTETSPATAKTNNNQNKKERK
jgi:hypothetical protein